MTDLVETSPFHWGEIMLQRRIGSAERIGAIGSKVVRSFMPDQHRDFFAQLPFVLVGAVDQAGDAWASLAAGKPGFMTSPDPTSLEIRAARDAEDPADGGLEDGDSVGLLGIELHTRRRNRLNGRLRRANDSGFVLEVEHSFGNCPKYIQLRDFESVSPGTRPPPVWLQGLDARARQMIASADTFFVASYADREDGHRQVDVSHRGGKPGFVRIDENDRLTIPDFLGNHYFNTLGNIVANGKAGLLFPDFDTGDLLQLTGDARVELDANAEATFQGSEHIWTFTPRRMVYRAKAAGLRWHARADGQSPFNATTGVWNA
ncbi:MULTISPECIES: pyridoxamine 5'-phosphate oxidase family protein [unclassified Beijerinckia]|uniref:pyridoxamine 5'-phosphate oxidase family protein n=1 Tax=unclassified Beijerinckia TaxID=2638183 RepID=UPI000899A421|nr:MULTISPECIES: pyridoxamine 5'-phosphate oxidase family protein [unclassified Beijerinckia]MDH7796193.1 putative pyridoxine 5'-phosphate oxidase superfamily flavin-nucleotide-binding protein [Beijerinckia sp. GAS462]SEC34375.1 hypothetical protein SAMN05443249_2475 [Beijerinckia sp. 28-YEA-48]